MKDGRITGADWVRSLGSGLAMGAAFVAVAMLVEGLVIRAGSKLFSK